jgi:hypothetical protein
MADTIKPSRQGWGNLRSFRFQRRYVTKCVHLGKFAARNIVCHLKSWPTSKPTNAATA